MNNTNDDINVTIKLSENKAESAVFGQLLESYPQGLLIRPAFNYHAGDLGRLIPNKSIIFADFYKKNLNVPPASNLKINMKLNAGYIFNNTVVLAITEYGVYIKNEPLADEIESIKFVPYSAMSYCDFSVIDDSAFIDLENIDDPAEPETAADPEPAAASC